MLEKLSTAEFQLLEAAAKGNIESVRQLLSDPSINLWARDSSQRLALHRACMMPFFTDNQDGLKSNKILIVSELMTRDPSTLQAQDDEGNTPVHLMASNGFDAAIAKTMNDHPSALTIANSNGLLPLHMAISAHQNTIARLLLDHPQLDEQVVNALVHHMVKSNHLDSLIYLCKQHPLIDLNVSLRGITPIDIAHSMHLQQMSEFLIEHMAASRTTCHASKK